MSEQTPDILKGEGGLGLNTKITKIKNYMRVETALCVAYTLPVIVATTSTLIILNALKIETARTIICQIRK